MMNPCPACSTVNSPAAKFCAGCGKPLSPPVLAVESRNCPACGTLLSLQAKFCRQCGHRMPPVGATIEAAPMPRCRCRLGSLEVVVDANRPAAVFGRDPGCDFVIPDVAASRRHCRLELRDRQFVLNDTSTNGTFVVVDEGAELLLQQTGMTLSGRGRFSCGRGQADPACQAVLFEIVA